MSIKSVSLTSLTSNKECSDLFLALEAMGLSAIINYDDESNKLTSDINLVYPDGSIIKNHIDENGKSTISSKGFKYDDEYILNDR